MNRRQNEERDRRIREEFQQRRESGERSMQVIRELADRVCRSEKRVQTVAYERQISEDDASSIEAD